MNDFNSQDDEKLEEARQLRKQVDEHLRDGQLEKAKRAFSRNWRDAVPELPFRFHPILQKSDPQQALLLRSRLQPGAEVPDLRLRYVGGRLNPQAIEVWTVGKPKLFLGQLPAKDVKFLSEIGHDAQLYRPSLLEISLTEDSKLDYIAVELAREEILFCALCGKTNNGPYVFCEQCRKERPEAEETTEFYENTPVDFHELIEAISLEHGHSEEDDNIFEE